MRVKNHRYSYQHPTTNIASLHGEVLMQIPAASGGFIDPNNPFKP